MAKSVSRQCEDALNSLKAIFRASRHVGPRPDVVFRALVQAYLVEFRGASELLRETIKKSLDFRSEAIDRGTCWEECDVERRRLWGLHIRLRKEEIQHERLGKIITVARQKHDQEMLDALTKELEALAQPLPDSSPETRDERST